MGQILSGQEGPDDPVELICRTGQTEFLRIVLNPRHIVAVAIAVENICTRKVDVLRIGGFPITNGCDGSQGAKTGNFKLALGRNPTIRNDLSRRAISIGQTGGRIGGCGHTVTARQCIHNGGRWPNTELYRRTAVFVAMRIVSNDADRAVCIRNRQQLTAGRRKVLILIFKCGPRANALINIQEAIAFTVRNIKATGHLIGHERTRNAKGFALCAKIAAG